MVGVLTREITGTVSYNGSKSITVIDVDNFYFTATWVATETGWWSIVTEGRYDTAVGYQAGYLLTTGSNGIFVGANAGYRQTTLDNLFIVDSVATARASAAVEITNSIIYGVMAATPAAQTLALNAVVKTGGRKRAVNIQTTTYTATVADEVIVCNSTTAFTVTLPVATGSGQTYAIKNINTGAVTVSKAGDTIDGETTQTLGQWDAIQLVDVAANVWIII